jgi:Holliday junction resolvasome RuvABC endonuclease subunit
MNGTRRYAFVLAVYANTRGFAVVLFEGPLSPIDWGVKEMRGRRKHARALTRVNKLLDRYEPDVLVIQDTSPQGTQRARRITKLNGAIAQLSEARTIPLFRYSRLHVLEAFRAYGMPNKHELAEIIAKHIPAFERYVPPPRKPWMSEDARMGLFDAAALALVFFQKAGGSEGQVA